MIRLASALMLVALATALLLVVRTDGRTATTLLFVGAPSLFLGLGLWGVALRRAAKRGAAGKPL